jgi:hypothetical protein
MVQEDEVGAPNVRVYGSRVGNDSGVRIDWPAVGGSRTVENRTICRQRKAREVRINQNDGRAVADLAARGAEVGECDGRAQAARRWRGRLFVSRPHQPSPVPRDKTNKPRSEWSVDQKTSAMLLDGRMLAR